MKNIFAIIFVLLIVFFGATTLVAEDNSEKTINDIATYFREEGFFSVEGLEKWYEDKLLTLHEDINRQFYSPYYYNVPLNMGCFNSVVITSSYYDDEKYTWKKNFAIIYKYDMSEPGARYILEEIQKSGVIWLKGSQVPAIVNGSFVLTMYHFSDDKDKIKELFMKF